MRIRTAANLAARPVLVPRRQLIRRHVAVSSAASASPTPLLPGYPMPATPSTSASTKTLWVGLELGVLAGSGRVVAASSGARRSTAITAMSTPLAHAMALGSAVPGWPGWV